MIIKIIKRAVSMGFVGLFDFGVDSANRSICLVLTYFFEMVSCLLTFAKSITSIYYDSRYWPTAFLYQQSCLLYIIRHVNIRRKLLGFRYKKGIDPR